MVRFGEILTDKAFQSRAVRRWSRAARRAADADLSVLRLQRSQARSLKSHLDALIHTADERLAFPLTGAAGLPKPRNADWAWRPELWCGALPVPGVSSVSTKSKLGHELTLFHDCKYSDLTLRQLRNLRTDDLAPYGLCMDVFSFGGSFLSLVVDFPGDAMRGLKRTHLLRMEAVVEIENPLKLFARLNIKHGPNTLKLVQELHPIKGKAMMDFDLAYSNLNEKRVECAWVDLIFDHPEMNQVVLRDLTFSRRPRAQI